VPRKTTAQLRRVLSYSFAHKGLVVLSIALMGFQAAASNARLLLLWPIMTRVFGVDESTATRPETAGVPAPAPVPGPAPGGGAEDQEGLKKMVGEARRRGGKFLGPFDRMIDGINSMTGAWVSDDWIAGRVKNVPLELRPAALAEQRDKFATLYTVLLLFFGFMVVMSLSAYYEDYVNERMRLRILMDVRRDLCSRLLQQPMAFYDAAHRGDVVQRILDDVYAFSIGLKLVLSTVIEGSLHIVMGIVILAALSVELTMVCLVGLLFFIPMRAFSKRVRKQARKRQAGSARRVEVLLQIVSGIRTVKAFRAEDKKISEFTEADREVYKSSLRVQRTKSGSDALTEFVNNLLVMVLTVGGSFLVLRGVLPIGPAVLVLFLMQVGNLYKPAKKLVRDLNGMNDAMASIERVFEILDLPGPRPDPAGAKPFPGVVDRVRYEHVGFSYRPGLPVVHDVSFDIEKGTTVALVGPSGGGKSTLCDLLLRFYEPAAGRITIDGTPLEDFRRTSYLDRTAVVTQDPFLFHTSIGENIRLGKPNATEAEVVAAAKAAQIHEHIASLQDGYATEVGERGARLSGGQRQRITIARALLRDPALLVLDEATASLDTASERGVQEALERLREGRTTLVVAHRLSTVKRADRIVVLDQGRVVDQGTHEELLARGGLYARLCAMQDLGHTPEPDLLEGASLPEDPAAAPGAAT
jgi:ABC-type multidrug transport system fused ATPase/permease subunit